MAYRPLLGVGKEYSLLSWEVVSIMLATTGGLVAFAAALERYLIRKATWLETALFVVAASGLFWPTWWADMVGWAVLALVIALQKFHTPQGAAPALQDGR